jgi:eukaryotic-like serine/threonine-protein kinase
MKRAGFYKEDWFIALVIGLVFSFAILINADFLERLEFTAYDAGVKMTNRVPGATDQIAIVAIDDQSIKEIGRWPWPRSVLAGVLDKLTQSEARAIGVLIYLTEPQADPGLTTIRTVRTKLAGLNVPRPAQAQFTELRLLLEASEKHLDADGVLAIAIPKAPRLHLPMITHVGEQLGKPDRKLPEYVHRSRLSKLVARPGDQNSIRQIAAMEPPLEAFGDKAAGIGHLSYKVEKDNGIRAIHTVLEFDGEYYPSLPLLLAASSLNIEAKDIELEVGRSLRIGRLTVPTDSSAIMYTGFYRPNGDSNNAFSTYSFRDVQTDKLPASVFKNKIVLIGPTATGVASKYATPITGDKDELMSESELTANVIASILNQDFYTSPKWTGWSQAGIVLTIVLYLMFAVPRMSGKTAALTSLIVLIVLLGAGQYLMMSEKVWLQTVSPALLLFVGHMAITSKRFFLTERLKLEAETDSAYSNRMLGLAFQAQGQLDMALDKFRKLPVDDSVLELFYNLALDFERKRQFNKGVSAYDFILKHDPKFRDVADRKKRATQADQTIVLGGRTSAGGTVVLDGGAEKPTLGRYAVEKELGRGAMGTVYLGRDPKINRLVAIKTMALSQEFEQNQLDEVRERFFREAETAGRLRHPNIVTIYDAGEEHDLAYIAMEYLEGKDLADRVGPDKNLPFDWILDISIKITDALDFAHRNDVVHRDIKPANIIYNDADKSIKVTDFGIARITASSRTKTGVVLGTPSYMSPEQLAGKHVDGRSDLFSFGVMLYEMVSGKTPFNGDSLATLMYQIANAPTPDVKKLRSDTPKCVVSIIERLLEKDADKRYATGAEVKQELEQCRSKLKPTKA